MLILSCKNLKSIDISKENGIAEKNDTLPKIGKIFKINNIECYFRINDTINDDVPDIVSIELKEYKTNRVLLSYMELFHSFDVNSDENFEDVNFDGYKDYYYTSYGSMVMNDLTHFYLFNKETKVFEYSEELTDSHIEDIDSINKKLIMSNDYRFGRDSVIHSFDNFGKIKFTEVFSEYEEEIDTIWISRKTYRKIINGEIVETKQDSIIEKWE